MRRRIVLGPIVAALAAATAVLVPATPAGAVDIDTPYPAVRIQPGQNATFDLTVRSAVSENVDVSVTGAPDGWQTVLRGGGHEVSQVHTSPDTPGTVSLEVDVPADAAGGDYQLGVVASGPSGTQTLPVRLSVVQQAATAFELTTDFPSLRGKDTDTYSFSLTLANHSPQDADFALSATGPDGWTVTASPSSEAQAATATVKSDGTATVAVKADPPDGVLAGTYDVKVQATGAGTTLESDLSVEITGTAAFTVKTSDERLNAAGTAGRAGAVTVVVANSGNSALDGVALTATAPAGWDVSFEPSTLDGIAPGSSAQAVARITPSGDAIAGDYDVTVSAQASGTTQTLDLRYAVKTSTWWGLVGIVIILAAVGGLVAVYRKYGRR